MSVPPEQAPPAAAEGDPREAVLGALGEGPLHIDEITGRTGLPVQRVSAELVMAEMQGQVVRRPGGVYGLKEAEAKPGTSLATPGPGRAPAQARPQRERSAPPLTQGEQMPGEWEEAHAAYRAAEAELERLRGEHAAMLEQVQALDQSVEDMIARQNPGYVQVEQQAEAAWARTQELVDAIETAEDLVGRTGAELYRLSEPEAELAPSESDVHLLETLQWILRNGSGYSDTRAYPVKQNARGEWRRADGSTMLIDLSQVEETIIEEMGLRDADALRRVIRDAALAWEGSQPTYAIGRPPKAGGARPPLKDWGEVALGVTPAELRAAMRGIRERLGMGRGWNLRARPRAKRAGAAATDRVSVPPVEQTPPGPRSEPVGAEGAVTPQPEGRAPLSEATAAPQEAPGRPPVRRLPPNMREVVERQIEAGRRREAARGQVKQAAEGLPEGMAIRPETLMGQALRGKKGGRQGLGAVPYATGREKVWYRERPGGPILEVTAEEWEGIRARFLEEGRPLARQQNLAGQARAQEKRAGAATDRVSVPPEGRAEATETPPPPTDADAPPAIRTPEQAEALRTARELLARPERFEQNTIVPKEQVQEDLEYFRSKRGQRGRAGGRKHPALSRFERPGGATEDLRRAFRVGVAYVEDFARNLGPPQAEAAYPVWADRMVAEVGEWVRPRLRELWEEAIAKLGRADLAYEQVRAEIVSPEEAARLSQPAVQLLNWYRRAVKELFDDKIAVEEARDRLREVLLEQGADETGLLGVSRDPYESLLRAATLSNWQYHDISTDGWFDPATGEKVAPGMAELERVATTAAPLADGKRPTSAHFWVYATMRRVGELLDRGVSMPGGWTPGAVRETLQYLESPEFAQAFEMLQQWQHMARLQLERAGLKPPGWAGQMRQRHPNYVRLSRVILEGPETGVPQRPDQRVPTLVHKIEGSRLLVKDPRSEMLRQAKAWLTVANHWESRRLLRDWLVEAGPERTAGIGLQVEPEQLAVELSPEQAQQLARRLAGKAQSETEVGRAVAETAGRAVNRLVDDLVDENGLGGQELQSVLTRALTGTELLLGRPGRLGENVIPVMVNGSPEYWWLHPDLVEVYAMSGGPIAPWLSRMLNRAGFDLVKYVKQVSTTTYAIKWVARNVLRDIPDAIMQSPGYFPVVRDWVPALRAVVGKSPEFRALTWQGALQAGREATSMDPGVAGELSRPGRVRPAIRQALGPVGAAADRAAEVAMKVAAAPFRLIEHLGQIGERTTRVATGLAERRAALARGLPLREATARGAQYARISTLPYMRKGRFVGAWNRYKAFLSAGFQGLYNPIKIFREAPLRTTLKGLLWITIPNMILYAINRDNPDWENLPAWRKYGSLNIPIGRDRKDETRWAFAPTPWAWHVLFAAAPIAAMEHLREQDPDVWKEFVAQAWSALSPTGEGVAPKEAASWTEVGEQIALGAGAGLAPDALSPLLGLKANQTWTGRDIVPYFEQGKAPELQVADWSSEMARLVGARLPGGGYSPRKVDYLLESYGSTLARDINMLVDRLAAETGRGTKPESPANQSWLERGVMGTASRSGDMREEFYAQMARLERVHSLYQAGREMSEEQVRDLDRYQEGRLVRSEMAKISREKREVVAGEDSREEKQRLLDRLTAEETLLLAEFLRRQAPDWAQEMVGRRR